MDSFFTNIHSALGWFGIIILIIALAVIGFLARKRLKRTRFGGNDYVALPLLGLAFGLAIMLLSQLGSIFGWIGETSRSIASNLESRWWTALLVITILVMIFDFFVPRKVKSDKEKESFVTKWDKWKPKFYFAVLWSVIILILNLIMSHLEIEAWQDLWTYKGTGSWFFSMIMILLVVSMVLVFNVEMIKIRWCGGILLFLAVSAWIRVAWTTDKVTEQGLVRENPAFTPLVVTETGERNLVPKGSTISFMLKDLISFDAVEFYVAIDDKAMEGPFPPGYLHDNKKLIGAKKLELRCDIQDFYVTLRKPVPNSE